MQQTQSTQPAILRRRDVCKATGLAYTTIWRLERLGRFPARVKLTATAVGWPADEVDQWCRDRVRVGASAGVAP